MNRPDAPQAPPSPELWRQKGSERIQINNILSAVCIGVLSVLLVAAANRPSIWAIGQLAVAIPCLVTSSLSYSKLCYRPTEEYRVWDTLGWFTHSIGYIMILNALTLMLQQSGYRGAAWLFIATIAALFTLYSLLEVRLQRYRRHERSWKLSVHLLLLLAGGIVPILAGWT